MAGTTPTSLAGTIATESIAAFTTREPGPPSVYEAISSVTTDCTGSSHQWVYEVSGDTVASKSPNASFGESVYSTAFVNSVPAVMGDSTPFADEIAAMGSSQSALSTLTRIDRRCNIRTNKDVLAAGVSSANHSDYTGLAMTVDRFIDAIALFGAQNHGMPRTCFVGSAGQIAELTKANLNLVSGGAGGAFAEGLLSAGRTEGAVCKYLETEIYRSDVFVDGANATALLVAANTFGMSEGNVWQPGSGLGIAFWWKSKPEIDRVGSSTKSVLTVSSMYTCKIAVPNNVRKITALK